MPKSQKKPHPRKQRRIQCHSEHPHAPADSHRPSADFLQYVNGRKKRNVGRDVTDENTWEYVTLEDLREYWTPHKFREAMQSGFLDVDLENIKTNYIRTFSTLVYCQRITSLYLFIDHNLSDDKLPLDIHPAQWPQIAYHQTLFSDFHRSQWLFFPFIFNPNTLYDNDLGCSRILPIDSLEEICGGQTSVKKIIIRGSCDKLKEQGRGDESSQHLYVLKTYFPGSKQQYNNEIMVLQSLRQLSSPNLITYYGSFQHSGTMNLILEYADRGNLADFFKENQQPKADEVVQFWKSLSKVYEGLHNVHHILKYLQNNTTYHGYCIHGDIKPENILLTKGPTGSSYDFIPKITDFGLSTHIRASTANSRDAMGNANHGNQIYSSPECSRIDPYQENGPNMTITRSDIWSMGAVFSNASAWVMGGNEGIKDYLRRRVDYNDRLRGSGYEGCFHDGCDLLPVVREKHEEILQYCTRVNDTVTPQIIGLVEGKMLLREYEDRYNAQEVMTTLKEYFPIMPEQDVTPPEAPGTTDTISQGARTPGPSLAELGNMVLETPLTYAFGFRKSRREAKVKIQKLVEGLKINIPDRHHLFFIDDSTSMEPHAKSVYQALVGLQAVTKNLEVRRTELSFASNPKLLLRTNRTQKLASRIENHQYRREPDMMENCFTRLIDDVILPRLPVNFHGFKFRFKRWCPMSIYIFTDGNWGDLGYSACGVERPLERLINELSLRRFDKNEVSLHFICFGNDVNGKRYLHHLDGLGSGKGRDNVDVKHVTSPVETIILGPISEANDRQGERTLSARQLYRR